MSILYVKGMNMKQLRNFLKHSPTAFNINLNSFFVSKRYNSPMESEESEEEEDIWDDTKLNQAYDKAVSMANAEIAKRIAMSTNNTKKTEVKAEQASPTRSRSAFSSHHAQSSGHGQPPPTSMWKAGMACRAIYDRDGLEYEAFILRVINDKECVVRFLGYENSEVVSISTLKPSLGKELRAKQIQDALADTMLCDEEVAKTQDRDEDVDMNDYAAAYKESQQSSTNKEDKKKKKKHSKRHHSDLPEIPFQMPKMPFQMPNMANFMESGMDLPIPPPPVTLLQSAGPTSEDQAMSSMLLSWYMSGYCTGYYQGMKKSQSSRRKHH